MANALAKFKAGRITLHLVCLVRKTNWQWHLAGIGRELCGVCADIYAEAKTFVKELGKL